MKKCDLKTYDVVLSTKGSYGIVLLSTPMGDLIHWYKNKSGQDIHKYRFLSTINDDLTFKNDLGCNRIIRVYRSTSLSPHCINVDHLVDNCFFWEEADIQTKEMTMQELENVLGYKVKIIN